ncbi:MAG: hypothetical protein JXR75_06230 [Rhodobacteraceae bacterium]|nr:hypothetical protein [Paracoccaceae bacterium]
MTGATVFASGLLSALRHLWQDQRVWLVSVAVLAVLAVIDPGQARDGTVFAGSALLHTAPCLMLSIALAAGAGATGADTLLAKAVTSAPLLPRALGWLQIRNRA